MLGVRTLRGASGSRGRGCQQRGIGARAANDAAPRRRSTGSRASTHRRAADDSSVRAAYRPPRRASRRGEQRDQVAQSGSVEWAIAVARAAESMRRPSVSSVPGALGETTPCANCRVTRSTPDPAATIAGGHAWIRCAGRGGRPSTGETSTPRSACGGLAELRPGSDGSAASCAEHGATACTRASTRRCSPEVDQRRGHALMYIGFGVSTRPGYRT